MYWIVCNAPVFAIVAVPLFAYEPLSANYLQFAAHPATQNGGEEAAQKFAFNCGISTVFVGEIIWYFDKKK